MVEEVVVVVVRLMMLLLCLCASACAAWEKHNSHPVSQNLALHPPPESRP